MQRNTTRSTAASTNTRPVQSLPPRPPRPTAEVHQPRPLAISSTTSSSSAAATRATRSSTRADSSFPRDIAPRSADRIQRRPITSSSQPLLPNPRSSSVGLSPQQDLATTAVAVASGTLPSRSSSSSSSNTNSSTNSSTSSNGIGLSSTMRSSSTSQSNPQTTSSTNLVPPTPSASLPVAAQPAAAPWATVPGASLAEVDRLRRQNQEIIRTNARLAIQLRRLELQRTELVAEKFAAESGRVAAEEANARLRKQLSRCTEYPPTHISNKNNGATKQLHASNMMPMVVLHDATNAATNATSDATMPRSSTTGGDFGSDSSIQDCAVPQRIAIAAEPTDVISSWGGNSTMKTTQGNSTRVPTTTVVVVGGGGGGGVPLLRNSNSNSSTISSSNSSNSNSSNSNSSSGNEDVPSSHNTDNEGGRRDVGGRYPRKPGRQQVVVVARTQRLPQQ